MRSMDEEMRHSLHSSAVNWYRGRKENAADRIEFIHHLSQTGDEEGLAEVLLIRRSALLALDIPSFFQY